MRPFIPLYTHPADDPVAWDAAARLGRAGTVVIAGVPRDPAHAAAVGRLAAAGVPTLGRVDLGYAARPLAAVLDEVRRWATYPLVCGVFLDRAPTGPTDAGPVALAVRVARRAGLTAVVLNTDAPPDPVYRDLGAHVTVRADRWQPEQGSPVPAGAGTGDPAWGVGG